jgi:dephospho-CoA kinase
MTTRPQDTQLTIIGITGTIGSGKSTVGKILEELGVAVIDSDKIVHGLLESDQQVKHEVIERFGAPISECTTNGDTIIDRKALGKIVFNDTEAKKDLEKILHPRVREEFRKQIAKLAEAGKTKVVAYLVPLLFETGQGEEYDFTWCVTTDENILRQRLAQRDNFSDSEITRRLSLQLSQDKKAALADEIIDNSTGVEQTRKRVVELLQSLG